jgi:hypothetical protein
MDPMSISSVSADGASRLKQRYLARRLRLQEMLSGSRMDKKTHLFVDYDCDGLPLIGKKRISSFHEAN